jgi:hypothetical protein
MASEKGQMVAAPLVIEDAEEMVVWDGPKKRIFDGQLFKKDKHSCPRVKTNPKIDIPLPFTGHLPNLGSITEAEEERLQIKIMVKLQCYLARAKGAQVDSR